MAVAALHVIENQQLRVELHAADLRCDVLHKPTKTEWKMFGADSLDLLKQAENGTRTQHKLSEFAGDTDIWQRPQALFARIPAAGISICVTLEGDQVLFEVAPEFVSGSPGFTVRDVLYPRAFILPQKANNNTTWALGLGSIVPANWTARFHHPEGYSEQALSFHGGYQGDTDGGYVAIAETPDDMYLAMWNVPGQAASTFLHWLPSLGALRYTRRVRYTFRQGMNYKAQAAAFREHAKKTGLLLTLKEKVKRNPNVEKLHGGCMIDCDAARRDMRKMEFHATPFTTSAGWVEEFRKKTGITQGSVHLDGWGKYGYDNLHPDTLPPSKDCGGAGALKEFSNRTKALGYLFGLHDQYIDNYFDAPSFMPEHFRHQENGQPVKVNNWLGGMAYHNCYAAAKKFVKRNVFDGVRDLYLYHNSASVVSICDPNTYYLDCFTRTVECFHPEHRLTRTENRRVQREILEMVRSGNGGQSQQIVLQCEHVRDFAVPEVEFSYGLGDFKADVEVVGGGHETQPIGISVPLWHLVFHDCVVLAHYGAAQGENQLYGCAPWFSLRNFDWSRIEGELPAKLRSMALHADIGFEPMTDHKLVSSDGSVQQTTFAGGVEVTFDKKDKTIEIKGGRAATKGPVAIGG